MTEDHDTSPPSSPAPTSEHDPDGHTRAGTYDAVAGAVTTIVSSFQRWFLLAAVLGLACGLGVAGIAIIAETVLLERVLHTPWKWLMLVAPTVGLAVAVVVVRYFEPDRTSETTEAFLDNYHMPNRFLGWRSIPSKLVAAIATVGSGGSSGMEGPSVYLGAALGGTEQSHFVHAFHSDEDKVLTVAGAAGGLAAIFRAPLTGVMFGMEGPYMHDLSRFAVAPSLIAASFSYLIYAIIRGTTPIFEIDASDIELVPFPEVLFGIVVGVACSLAARLFIVMNRGAERLFARVPLWVRVIVAGLMIGALGLAAFEMTGFPYTLGQGVPGARALLNGTLESTTVPLIALLVALVLMKMIATVVTLRAGGVGGVFFPLAFMGAGIGAIFTNLLDPTDTTLYPVIGIAAMIGSAFRAPLTAVAFIAETTGSAAYLIPGLIAAAAANALMGRRSISKAQERFELSSVTAARRRPLRELAADLPEPRRVQPSMTLEEYAAGDHENPALVIDDERLVGVITKDLLYSVDFEARPDSTVGDVMDGDPLTFDPQTVLRDAAGRLVVSDHECGVLVADGKPVGIVTEREILQTQEAKQLLRGTHLV